MTDANQRFPVNLPDGAVVRPITMGGGIMLLMGLAYAGLPEIWGAGAVLLLSGGLLFKSPLNGVAFLLLTLPFWLGESGWPWYGLPEMIIFLTLLAALIRWRADIAGGDVPLGRLLILLIGATIASLPIDGKSFVDDLWVTGFGDLFATWLTAHSYPKTIYLRVVTNLVSCIGLYLLAVRYVSRQGDERLVSLAKGVTLMSLLVGVGAYLLGFGWVKSDPDRWSYLTASLVGRVSFDISGFAYASHFFNQWLLLTMPMVLGLLFLSRKDRLWGPVSLTAAGMIASLLLVGGIRSSAALLTLIFVCFGGGWLVWATRRMPNRLRWGVIGGGVATALVIGLLLVGQSVAYERIKVHLLDRTHEIDTADLTAFTDDPMWFWNKGITEPRLPLWHTATKMFVDSPLMGIGSGRYSAMFLDYFPNGSEGCQGPHCRNLFSSAGTSAHSFYFHILAGQGSVGVLLWAGLFIMLFRMAFHAWRNNSRERERVFVLALMGTIVLWALYGVTHQIAYQRGIELLFWAHAGFLGGLARRKGEAPDIPETLFRVGLAIVLVGLTTQIYHLATRPLAPSYENGFYHWERQPDGDLYRWMGKRGAIALSGEGDQVEIAVRCPLGGLGQHPQRVWVSIGEEREEVVLTNADPHTIRVSVDPEQAGPLMVRIETDYTYNPKRDGGGGDDRDLGVMVGRVVRKQGGP